MNKAKEIETLYNQKGYKLLESFSKMDIKIKVLHLECGTEFFSRPKDFKRKNNHGSCPTCFPSKQMTKERYQFNIDSRQGKNKYSVLEFNGVKKGKTSTILHNLCGHIWVLNSPQTIYTRGCPKCFGNKVYNDEYIKNNIHDLTNGEYSYIGKNYKSESMPILIQHNICGHKWKVLRRNFTDRMTRCPICVKALRRSKSEEIAVETFTRYNIVYKSEVKFRGLRSDKGKSLLIDFYLKEFKIVIELDGEQHFFKRRDTDSIDSLLQIHARDLIKNAYFEDTEILFIRIPYTVSYRDLAKILKELVIGKELSSTTIEKHNIYYSTNNKSKLNYYRAINPKLCE